MQKIPTFAGVVEAGSAEHEDVFAFGDVEDLAALGVVDRLINIGVDAVGNVVDGEATQHTGAGLVGEPLADHDCFANPAAERFSPSRFAHRCRLGEPGLQNFGGDDW